jgi:hypothetical protein
MLVVLLEGGKVCRAFLWIKAVINEFGPQTPDFWLPAAFEQV